MKDPLNSKDENEVNFFIDFIKKELDKRNFINFYIILYKYKEHIIKKGYLKSVLKFFTFFKDYKLIIFLIKWKIYGDFISKSIFNKWKNSFGNIY